MLLLSSYSFFFLSPSFLLCIVQEANMLYNAQCYEPIGNSPLALGMLLTYKESN